jgi:P27 family predicted phage terminase small subunit
MRGRKPTPTHLKIISGNPGGRALNHNEPRPELVAPSPPKHLVGEALKEWKRISPELLELGLLTRIDRAALAMYCDYWALYVAMRARIQKAMRDAPDDPHAGLFDKTPQGYRMQSVEAQHMNRAAEQCLKFMTEFGMSPSSRSRVQTSGQLALPGLGNDEAAKKWSRL